MGTRKLPRWADAKEDAIAIFDEIITTLPRHELAAKSMFHKAQLLVEFNEFGEGIEVYETLIRRFPKHPNTPDSYVGIAKAYLKECVVLFPDTDFLELAEINLNNMMQAFPSDERITEVEECLLDMKEHFAKDLLKIAKYFEKKKKKTAAEVYYKSIIIRYPDTKTAQSLTS